MKKENFNWRKLFYTKKEIRDNLKKICPTMDNESGIYFYTRIDEDGSKQAYIGQALHLLDRTISHIQYQNQHIDVSLIKRGFYSQNNPYGWKLNFLHFPANQLNDKEKYYIDKYQQAGFMLYNIESGGSLGKIDIQERKLGKGYYEGIARGKNSLAQDLKHIIDLYLTIQLNKTGVRAENALNKFNTLLNTDYLKEFEKNKDKSNETLDTKENNEI